MRRKKKRKKFASIQNDQQHWKKKYCLNIVIKNPCPRHLAYLKMYIIHTAMIIIMMMMMMIRMWWHHLFKFLSFDFYLIIIIIIDDYDFFSIWRFVKFTVSRVSSKWEKKVQIVTSLSNFFFLKNGKKRLSLNFIRFFFWQNDKWK